VESYRITPKASVELLRFVEYVARESGPERAAAVLDDLLRAAEKLGRHPDIGHLRTDLTDEPVRFWAVHGCLLIYRSEVRPIELIHVVSGSRDVEAILRGDR
jgi:plasmid stabilization system protein ParE